MKKFIILMRWATSYTHGTFGTMCLPDGRKYHTCEPYWRDIEKVGKVQGETAIPAGCYQIKIAKSPRRGYRVPWLIDVPYFQGIQIHAGNTKADTQGCILVGKGYQHDAVTGVRRLVNSKAAFNEVFGYIQGRISVGDEVWIDVQDYKPVEVDVNMR